MIYFYQQSIFKGILSLMIEVKKSHIGNNKPLYNLVKNLSNTMYSLNRTDKKIFKKYLTLTKDINRELLLYDDNKHSFETFKISVENKINFYNKLIIDKKFPIGFHINNFENKIKKIVDSVENLDKKDIRNVRGLITEGICCSNLFDVNQQTSKKFIWDCHFYENSKIIDLIKDGKTTNTVDIFFNDNRINLYECKTSPNFLENRQMEFMIMLKEKYNYYGEKIELNLFILEDLNHPSIIRKLEDLNIDSYIKIKDINNI